MADPQQVQMDVFAIANLAQTILGVIPQTQNISGLVGPLAILVTKALSAYANAAGVPVTVESIKLLLPDEMPLVPPKE